MSLIQCPECGLLTGTLPDLTPAPHAPGCSSRAITKAEMRAFKREPVTEAWPLHSLQCRRCYHLARRHPQTRLLIGCLHCHYSSAAIYTHFLIPRCLVCGHYVSDHAPACELPRILPGRAASDPCADVLSHYCRLCRAIHPLRLKVPIDYTPP